MHSHHPEATLLTYGPAWNQDGRFIEYLYAQLQASTLTMVSISIEDQELMVRGESEKLLHVLKEVPSLTLALKLTVFAKTAHAQSKSMDSGIIFSMFFIILIVNDYLCSLRFIDSHRIHKIQMI